MSKMLSVRHLKRLATMPLGTILAVVSLLIAAVPSPAASTPRDSGVSTAIDITVAPGRWGQVRHSEIHTLLSSVAETFLDYTGHPANSPIHVRVVPRSGSPRVLYERGPGGEYLIHLSARDQRWYQYAYQFSHELCHIQSNFDHKDRDSSGEVATGNQWFEESLCETASLFTLRRLSDRWEQQPPSRNWLGYAPVFADYAEHLLAQEHRTLAGHTSFEQWYRAHERSLEAAPYLREKNEIVAKQLLSLFEREPRQWRAIRHLNGRTTSATKSFPDYLNDWLEACPEPDKAFVRQAKALFGFDRLRPQEAPIMIAKH